MGRRGRSRVRGRSAIGYEWTTDYDVLTSAFEVHVAEVTYDDDALEGVDGGVEAMMRECAKMNLAVGDASV